ncbi:hypothetical protein [Pacificispira sp.]|uniref:hypothetical protein n=1 Tax=Pacificispira sp. TaxID=2888761 RepID=UPI003BAA1DDE
MDQYTFALNEFEKATLAMREAVEKKYPVGSTVCWRHGRNVRHGTVRGYSFLGFQLVVEHGPNNRRRQIDPRQVAA